MIKPSSVNTSAAASVTIKDIFHDYILRNQDETGLLTLLQEQIEKQNDTELKSRKNFIGHVTAAAFIVDKSNRKVLLLEHKVLKKFLQPGGHIDNSSETPLNGAIRELEEETGIKIRQLRHRQAVPGRDDVPFDIDTHYIPENAKKNEPEHYHHDFRYLFIKEDELDITIDTTESNEYRWVEWDEFAKEPHFKKVARKIEELAFKS